ncbi:hypothetical protein CTAYLR_004598 [Chrysophaeum taylorii]|uniref:FHA domain-containing protein n=1 Tax=Chrysophaeum taylorii TaxID=2483200 RepID=A0AAD7UDJ1_9STRA|nr:hypothetical protein CTAYLR_004598 [Chrysophaeum taylorii]
MLQLRVLEAPGLKRSRVESTVGCRGMMYVLGRDARVASVVCPGRTVSRLHAIVLIEETRTWIINRSRHGTFVDGRLVRDRIEARPGSRLTLSSEKPHYRFVLEKKYTRRFSEEESTVGSRAAGRQVREISVLTWNVGAQKSRPNLDSVRNIQRVAETIGGCRSTDGRLLFVALQEVDAGVGLCEALRAPTLLRGLLEKQGLRWLQGAAGRSGKVNALLWPAELEVLGTREVDLGGTNAPMVSARLRVDHLTLSVGSAHVDCEPPPAAAAAAAKDYCCRKKWRAWLRAASGRSDAAIVAADFNEDLARYGAAGRVVSAPLATHGWTWGSYHGYHSDARRWAKKGRIIDGVVGAGLVRGGLGAELLHVPDEIGKIDPDDHEALDDVFRRHPPASDHFPVLARATLHDHL